MSAMVIASVLALLIALLLWYSITLRTFTWSIWFKLLFVKRAIKKLAKERSVVVKVVWLGAVRVSPRNLALWVKTDRDSERDQLRMDTSFKSGVYVALSNCNYPADAISHVGLEIESKERVDRECKGSWRIAMH